MFFKGATIMLLVSMIPFFVGFIVYAVEHIRYLTTLRRVRGEQAFCDEIGRNFTEN